jgi:DNA-binding XRE family transcriptional regulator
MSFVGVERMKLEGYRELLSWSQAELARQSGLNPATIGKAESGEAVSSASARAICRALSKALQRQILARDIEGFNVKL